MLVHKVLNFFLLSSIHESGLGTGHVGSGLCLSAKAGLGGTGWQPWHCYQKESVAFT